MYIHLYLIIFTNEELKSSNSDCLLTMSNLREIRSRHKPIFAVGADRQT